MATFNELSESYAKKMVAATSKEAAAKEILSEVQGLVYKSTQTPLSQEDKKEIIEKIREKIQEAPLRIAIKEADNAAYLELISRMLRELERKP